MGIFILFPGTFRESFPTTVWWIPNCKQFTRRHNFNLGLFKRRTTWRQFTVASTDLYLCVKVTCDYCVWQIWKLNVYITKCGPKASAVHWFRETVYGIKWNVWWLIKVLWWQLGVILLIFANCMGWKSYWPLYCLKKTFFYNWIWNINGCILLWETILKG